MRHYRRQRRIKRRVESHDNQERWLLTYSDMITLLLGLFIILYSISNVDKQKLESVSNAIRSGFGFSTGGVTILDGGSGVLEEDLFKPKSQVFRLWENLGFSLKKWKEAAKIQLGLAETEELKIILYASIPENEEWIVDDTQDETYKSIAKISEAMDIEILVRLEIPAIQNGTRTNWEDSARRTAKLAELLESKYNIPREKIAILAHTKFTALPGSATNSPEQRAKQERIELLIRKKK
ncbi:MAG: endoflagellar motor protein [Leptospira sp.]|jgi:chemotaxis protein MotB|nr:endoflagellar motor protein [Leptospira sp.]NCS92234.1 endoflagellar motor protein [Leptospira sp.]